MQFGGRSGAVWWLKRCGLQGYFLTNIMSAQSFLETVCTDDGELRHEKVRFQPCSMLLPHYRLIYAPTVRS
eukprot:1748435-Rhodomonas_salina.1